MSQEAPSEVVRKVEESPLEDLLRVSIDEVQVQMDSYLEPEIDSASLYRRWEKQQWAVSDLDFSEDARQWATIPEGSREAIRRTMTLFFIGRHTVFFYRFFDEVLEVHGGLRAALEAVGPQATEGFRRIFDTHLADATDLVRREPGNRRAWVEAIVTYHLIIEGYLALAGQRNLLRYFRSAGLMPGFTTGFTAVARDESRHIGFGVLALRRRVTEDGEMGRVVARKVLELLEPAAQTAVNPESRLNIPDPATVPAELRQSPIELREFSIGSLVKRLRSVGLSDSTVEDLASEMRGIYGRLWDRYEEIHGTEHPVRWYQRQEAAAAP
ncbi:MAG: hypothetical protein JF924_05150 [Candidatus Dormibacteraeota bacterium]|nr:hypothetical protein [Candidatus Dormibacteraeota bacterium]